MSGGYDDGYLACPCFWGAEPGSLVLELMRIVPSVSGWRVLDVGCGEGKNAVYLAERGAVVTATEISEAALRNARNAWGSPSGVEWKLADARTLDLQPGEYDLVIAYGLLHCLANQREVDGVIKRLKRATRVGGYQIVCAFNSRHHDLSAHPGFEPTLLPHTYYQDHYDEWDVLVSTDSDLYEEHPHNNVPHTHSLTRLLVRRPRKEVDR